VISQYFPSRIDLYDGTQSEPKQGFVLFEFMPANEISLVDSCKKNSQQTLHRSIETTAILGMSASNGPPSIRELRAFGGEACRKPLLHGRSVVPPVT